MKHLYAKITLSVAVIVMALAGFLGQNTSVSATKTSINASVTIPEACTMYGSGMDSHTATINPNTYRQDIGKTTFTVKCNDANGFAIYAIGFTGDAYDGDNTKLIGQSTNTSISTKTYASGDSTSNWSMKVSKVTDSAVSYNPANMSIQNSFDNWHVIPASYTKVAQYHANTGSSATDTELGAKIETTYATYIASNQPADVYEGKVKYTLVHPYNEQPLQPQQANPGCINYFANAGNAVGTMGCQPAADGNSIDLLASNFSRTGYGFAGWSDSFDYATNPSAHFYGPQETITVPTGTTANGLSLYAVWVKSQGSIQDGPKVYDTCNSLTTAPTDGTANLSSVSAFTDERDNNTYAIAKLADGKCWMIENLRLENTNSDNSTGALAQGYGTSATYGNFGGLANSESSNFNDIAVANSLYYSGTQSGNASIDIGTTNNPSYRIPRYNNINTSTRASSPISNNTSMYSYGNYYTWHAALANTIDYSGPTATDANGKTSETVGTSLCPIGWKLPYGRSSSLSNGVRGGGFSNLDIQLGGIGNDASANTNPTGAAMSIKWRSFPNNFLYSGYYTTSLVNERGSCGIYLSSTAAEYRTSHNLCLSQTEMYPGTDYYNKYFGASIRCVDDNDFTPPPL